MLHELPEPVEKAIQFLRAAEQPLAILQGSGHVVDTVDSATNGVDGIVVVPGAKESVGEGQLGQSGLRVGENRLQQGVGGLPVFLVFQIRQARVQPSAVRTDVPGRVGVFPRVARVSIPMMIAVDRRTMMPAENQSTAVSAMVRNDEVAQTMQAVTSEMVGRVMSKPAVDAQVMRRVQTVMAEAVVAQAMAAEAMMPNTAMAKTPMPEAAMTEPTVAEAPMTEPAVTEPATVAEPSTTEAPMAKTTTTETASPSEPSATETAVLAERR